MQLYKGYVPTKDKKCLMPFKNATADELLSFEQVKNLPEYAGILSDETILVDVDDMEQSVILLNIVENLNLKCRVYTTSRGKHFLFKNTPDLVKSNRTKATLAVGLEADLKIGSRNSYEVLKYMNEDRPILYDVPEDEIQELPKWLIPVKTDIDFKSLGEGDGRNDAFYRYILTLQDNDLTKEEARECIRLINRYVLKKPLSDKELDVILRDEAFQKQSFFKGRSFQHDRFAEYLKRDSHIAKINGRLHIYQDGIYTPSTEAIEKAMVTLIPFLKDAQRKETLKQLNLICDTRQPASPELLAFSNGLYNIRDGSFKEFTPDVVITNKIPWPYNPAAHDDLLDHTLNRLACDDPEVRALLEEMVGYCMYRRNELGKAFILIGDKSNGKSTFLHVVKNLLGDQNIASLDLKELGDRFKTAELFGKLANIGDDIGSDYVANVATFRKLVTGERVSAERKGQDPFEFDSFAKLLFSANAIPRLGRSKESFSIMRRLVIVPFDAKFTSDDPDFNPNIRYDLQDQTAMEYMIQLGLGGLKRVLKNKDFTKSKDVERTIEEYRIESNPLLSFLDEVGTDAVVNEPVKAVYFKYREFCITNQFEPLNRIEFSRQVTKALSFATKDKRINGAKEKIFVEKVPDA